ncbi:porin [Paludibacterium purpuratum]|nr:porin [Paludibacterium purpuratum]
MKKLSLVMAVAAALPVLAHADVTISGSLNVGIDSIKYAGTGGGAASTARTTGVDDFGSQIVFSGTEDLGNGLKTVWKISNGFNADGVATDGSGSGTLGNRETYVGLKSDTLGQLRMGKLNDVLLETESTDNMNGPRRDSGAQGGGNINTPLYEEGSTPGYGKVFSLSGGDGRQKNTIKYDMPEWNGISGQLQYTAGETTVNNKSVKSQYGFHVNYNNAATNLFVGAAYLAEPDQGGNHDKTSATSRIEGGYNGDNLTVALTFNHDSLYGDTTAAAASRFTTLYGISNSSSHMSGNSWGTYVAYQIGNWKPQAEYSRRQDISVDGQKLSTSASEVSFELDYTMSKRTGFYVGYAQLTESDGLKNLQQDDSNKSNMVYAGMVHHF